MDIVVTGRHCTISPELRETVAERLATVERLRDRVIRIEVEFEAEDGTKDPSDAITVQLTLRSRGPVVRAEAKASDKMAAFEQALTENPKDEEARLALGQVKLMQRTQGVDLQAARDAAAKNPADVTAQTQVADLDVLGGHVEDAFARLVDVVKATSGDERNAAREHLIGLFDVVGATDPSHPYPEVPNLLTIADDFGDWASVTEKFFAEDGGIVTTAIAHSGKATR